LSKVIKSSKKKYFYFWLFCLALRLFYRCSGKIRIKNLLC